MSREDIPTRTVATPAEQTQAERCVNADRWPFVVKNDTRQPALVFDGRDCNGNIIGVVPPGQTRTFDFGESAYFRA
ncbi:hypothetical protein AAHZ94_03220 [Streptomyces sp. HSW2009]|uniref:hypothetical protein n=1 Tax=Streptomyces sp. HSW2009 TaxID=3142890 RepID=UPI0032EEB142